MPSLMRMINVLSRCYTMYRGDRLRDHELNTGFYNYVLPIHFHPGMSQEQLARHVCMDKSNVTRHLAKLEEGGYVERRSSETDRRVTLVYPTDKLEELVPTIREINQEWTNYVMEGLSEEEIAQFEATLLKIARRAKEYVNSKDEIET